MYWYNRRAGQCSWNWGNIFSPLIKLFNRNCIPQYLWLQWKKNLKPVGQKKTVREIFFWYLMIRKIFFISRKEKVLGSFPKAFSNVKWKFPKWQLPKSAISQAATSQMTIFQMATSLHLGSCLLGKCPWEVASWENALGKLPLGKRPLGKYLISKKTYVSKMLFILIIDDPLLQRLQCPIYVYNGIHIIA